MQETSAICGKTDRDLYFLSSSHPWVLSVDGGRREHNCTVHAIDRSIFRYGWWVGSPKVPLLEVRSDVPAQEQPGPSPEEVRGQLPPVLPPVWSALPPPWPLQGTPAEEALHGGRVHAKGEDAAFRQLASAHPAEGAKYRQHWVGSVRVVKNATFSKIRLLGNAVLSEVNSCSRNR